MHYSQFGAFFIAASLFAIVPACAGDITATASQNYVHVEIIFCNQSDLDNCPLVFNGPMTQGQSITSNTGHLCYKRENYPGDASRGMEVNWNCDSNSIDTPDTFSID
jgi:hypothetical protein